MKVKGKRTEVSYVDVEIDVIDIFMKMWKDCTPVGAEYLKDGVWYKQGSFDYHKREELYCEMREATPQEIEIHNAFTTIINYTKK